MSQERIRREFNRWAELGRGRGMEKSHWDSTLRLLDMVDVGEHDNVADLGCGAGWATRVLAQKARGFVVGFDLSDRLIAQARTAYRNPPNALFVVADAEKIPCAAGFFDSVLSVDGIYYHSDLDAVFSEVHRILNLNGRAFFLINYYKENPYGHEWAKHIDIPVHLLGAEDYVGLLSKAGFRSATHRRIINSNLIPEDWSPTHWFPTKTDYAKFQAEGALLLSAEK